MEPVLLLDMELLQHLNWDNLKGLQVTLRQKTGLYQENKMATTLAAIAMIKAGLEHAEDLKDIDGRLGMQSNRLIEQLLL